MSDTSPAGAAPLVHLRSVSRTFRASADPVTALDGVDLDVEAGSFVIVHGRSGSGKTTLLNVMGGLDRPESGAVRVCGLDLVAADDGELAALRRTDVSYVFQGFGLLPVLSAAENVEVPLRLLRWAPDARRERVADVLARVGLGDRAHHRPTELSGGEQQRVAIARAIAAGPQLLIADEPTGQLDSRTGAAIIDLLRDLVDREGLTAVVATHDDRVIGEADERVEMSDGRASTSRGGPQPVGGAGRGLPGRAGDERDRTAVGAPESAAGPEPAIATPETRVGDGEDDDAPWRPPDS